MKNLMTGLCLSSIFFLMGCAQPKTETTTVLAPAACSQETIDAYNNIYKLARSQTKISLEMLTSISSSCAVYNNSVGSGSCKVIDTNTGNMTDVSSANVEPICSKVNSLLKKNTPGTSVGSLKKGLILKIKNEVLINQLIKDGIKSVVHEGQVTASTVPVTTAFCTLTAKRKSYETRDGDSIKLSQISKMGQQKNSLKMMSSDKNLQIACYHAGAETTWTVEELTSIFGDLAQLEIVR